MAAWGTGLCWLAWRWWGWDGAARKFAPLFAEKVESRSLNRSFVCFPLEFRFTNSEFTFTAWAGVVGWLYFVLAVILFKPPVQGLSGYAEHFCGQPLVAVGASQGFLDQDIAGLFQGWQGFETAEGSEV